MFQLSISTILTSPTARDAELVPALSADFSAALAGIAEASALSVPTTATPATPRQDDAETGKSLPTAAAADGPTLDPALAWLDEGEGPTGAPVTFAPSTATDPAIPASAPDAKIAPATARTNQPEPPAVSAAMAASASSDAQMPSLSASSDRQAGALASATPTPSQSPAINLTSPSRTAAAAPAGDGDEKAADTRARKHETKPADDLPQTTALAAAIAVLPGTPPPIGDPIPAATNTVRNVRPTATASIGVPSQTAALGRGVAPSADSPALTAASTPAIVRAERSPLDPASVAMPPGHFGGSNGQAAAPIIATAPHPTPGSAPAPADSRPTVAFTASVATASGASTPSVVTAIGGDPTATTPQIGTRLHGTPAVTAPVRASAASPVSTAPQPIAPATGATAVTPAANDVAPIATIASAPIAPAGPSHQPTDAQPPATRLAADAATRPDSSAPPLVRAPETTAPPAPVLQPAQTAALMFGIAFGGVIAGQRPLGADRPSPREQALQALTALAGAAPAAPIAAPGQAQHNALDMRRDDWPQAMIDHIEALRDAADATSTRITLVPDALGKVDLSIRHDGNTVHVHFAADAAQTRAILTDAQPKLAELAQQRGFRLGQATVDAGAGDGGQRQQPQTAAPPPQRPASAFNSMTAEDAADPTRLA